MSNPIYTCFAQHPRACSLLSTERVYFYPNIPVRKLQGAFSSYLPKAVDPDDALLLIDDTVFGSGKVGLVVAVGDLYIGADHHPVQHFPLHEIEQLSWKAEFASTALMINGQRVISLATPDRQGVDALCAGLNSYLVHFKAHITDGLRSLTKQLQQRAAEVEARKKQAQQQKEEKHRFELCLVMVDIFSHFACINGGAWNRATASYVLDSLDELIANATQYDQVIARIKKAGQLELGDAIADFLDYQPPTEGKAFLVIKVYELLILVGLEKSAISRITRSLDNLLDLNISTALEIQNSFTDIFHDRKRELLQRYSNG